MDKLKNYLMLLTAVLVVCPIMADDNGKMLVIAGDKSKVYEISDVRRIDFADEGISVIEITDEGITYAFEELQRIVFNPSDAEAIEDVSANSQVDKLSLFVSADGSSITVKGWNNQHSSKFEIYSVGGSRLLNLNRWSGEIVNVSNLPSGVYLLKVGNKSAKFRK